MATAYTNTSHGVTLNLLVPLLDDSPVTSHMLSTAMTHALDTELHAHMQQQRQALQEEEGVLGAEGGVPRSPFSNSAAAGGAGGCGCCLAAASETCHCTEAAHAETGTVRGTQINVGCKQDQSCRTLHMMCCDVCSAACS